MRKYFITKENSLFTWVLDKSRTISNQLINLGMKTNTKVTIVSNTSFR